VGDPASLAGVPLAVARTLAPLYARAARARREAGRRHARPLRQPVVSIGNLSVGGSGKTPLVAFVASLLRDLGERPAVLSRGYARQRAEDGVVVVSDGRSLCADVDRAGDEPMWLARALPGVAVLVAADRHLAGALAESRLGATVHVLDDGFQHHGLARDVDLVVVSAADLADVTLPAGRLREPLEALARADALVVPAGD
jgi:tetraacyldisaccharide 4'-kinase